MVRQAARRQRESLQPEEKAQVPPQGKGRGWCESHPGAACLCLVISCSRFLLINSVPNPFDKHLDFTLEVCEIARQCNAKHPAVSALPWSHPP